MPIQKTRRTSLSAITTPRTSCMSLSLLLTTLTCAIHQT
jgi:hypothetical protein